MKKKPTITARVITGFEIGFFLGISAVMAGAFGALVKAVSLLP